MNPVVDLANALSALKFKRARFVSVREGTEIQQPGKPTLLLTWSAVQAFANECEEAANADWPGVFLPYPRGLWCG